MIEQFLFSIIVFMACAGGVVALHQSPVPLPNIRPFNCAFCLIVWIAVGFELRVHYAEPQIEPLLCAACYPLYAGLLVGLAPWMFRSFETKVEAESKPETESVHEFLPTDAVAVPVPAKTPVRNPRLSRYRNEEGLLIVER